MGGLITLFILLPNLRDIFFSPASLVGMILALLFYYLDWGRYLRRGRNFRLLYETSAGIPLPLAISLMVYFLAASALLHSLVLLGAAILLGIGHIYISSLKWRRAIAPSKTV